MKKKLLSSILSLTLVFSATHMCLASANDEVLAVSTEADQYGVDNNMSEDGGPASMLPDENEVPDVDYSVDNNMSEQDGDPVGSLTDDYGVNNNMSEQGGTPVADPDEAVTFPETGVTPPTIVPSTGVTLLAKLF